MGYLHRGCAQRTAMVPMDCCFGAESAPLLHIFTHFDLAQLLLNGTQREAQQRL
jgi:hypothetical protein